MVPGREVEQMRRGFVGGGVIVARVMALAALVAVVLWSQAAGQNLTELDTISWFDADDPLNRTFRSALVVAASGVFPSPA